MEALLFSVEGLGMGGDDLVLPLVYYTPQLRTQELVGGSFLAMALLQCKSTYIKYLDLWLEIFLLHIVPNRFNCPSVNTHPPLPQICLSHSLLHNLSCFPHSDAETVYPPPLQELSNFQGRREEWHLLTHPINLINDQVIRDLSICHLILSYDSASDSVSVLNSGLQVDSLLHHSYKTQYTWTPLYLGVTARS